MLLFGLLIATQTCLKHMCLIVAESEYVQEVCITRGIQILCGDFVHEVVSGMSHNKAALGSITAGAAFMDWDTNQLCEQGLGQTADLWMARYYSSKRTTITTDSIRPIALFQFCQSTEFIENVNGHLKACLQVAGQHIPLSGKALTCSPQKSFHLFRRHLLTQNFQELSHNRTVSLGEQCLGI
jgi:hypothetical protein